MNGEFEFMYFTPEAILQRKRYRKLIASQAYQRRIKGGLIIDEVHTIKKW